MADKRKTNKIFVQYNSKIKQWEGKKSNAQRASVTAGTKKEAYNATRVIAKNQRLELVSKTKDGKISNPNSFGNDSCPPRDTK